MRQFVNKRLPWKERRREEKRRRELDCDIFEFRTE
jgi:hypothetical protein